MHDVVYLSIFLIKMQGGPNQSCRGCALQQSPAVKQIHKNNNMVNDNNKTFNRTKQKREIKHKIMIQ